MTLFVDASAVVAIAGKEDDWEELAIRLNDDERRLWSPLAQWESVGGLRSRLGTTPDIARERVLAFASDWGFEMVPIGAAETDLALDAYERMGRNSGHPARLNMGDCFAYACTKVNGARLLYKGDDFSRTDLA
ncbi:MAG: type II toxin-antitoxin system VapC family toxin [Pseudomonadota bacterium]